MIYKMFPHLPKETVGVFEITIDGTVNIIF